jgi:hypothetical protein
MAPRESNGRGVYSVEDASQTKGQIEGVIGYTGVPAALAAGISRGPSV